MLCSVLHIGVGNPNSRIPDLNFEIEIPNRYVSPYISTLCVICHA